MRHIRSIFYALVLAPAAWVLTGVGLTGDLTARGRDGFAVESFTGLLLLLLAGAAYGILVLGPISPAGPLLAGVAYLAIAAWALMSPSAYAGVWPHAVVKDGFDLSRPGYGLAALLAVPLICTALSARRWARYEPPVLPVIGRLGRARGAAPAAGVPLAATETAVLGAPSVDPDPTTVLRRPSDLTTAVVGVTTLDALLGLPDDDTIALSDSPASVAGPASDAASPSATVPSSPSPAAPLLSAPSSSSDSSLPSSSISPSRPVADDMADEPIDALVEDEPVGLLILHPTSTADEEPDTEATAVDGETTALVSDTPVSSVEDETTAFVAEGDEPETDATVSAVEDETAAVDGPEPELEADEPEDDHWSADEPHDDDSLDGEGETAATLPEDRTEVIRLPLGDAGERTQVVRLPVGDAAERTQVVRLPVGDAAERTQVVRLPVGDAAERPERSQSERSQSERSQSERSQSERSQVVPFPTPAPASPADPASPSASPSGSGSSSGSPSGDKTQVIKFPTRSPGAVPGERTTRDLSNRATGDVGGDETQVIRLAGKTVDEERTQVIRPMLVPPPSEHSEVIQLRPAAPRDGAARDGAARDGAPHDGAPHDGAPHDGAPHDGALHDGALHDGAARDGAARDAGPVSIADAEAPNFAEDPTSPIIPPHRRKADEEEATAAGKRSMTVMNMERPPDEHADETTHVEIPSPRRPADDQG